MSHAFIVMTLFIILQPVTLFGQDSLSLNQCEEKLTVLYNSILNENPYNRENISRAFYDEFYTMLEEEEGSFTHPFSKLENIGKIYSADKRIRIYTWNIPYAMDKNLYYGIVQYYSNVHEKYIAVKLNDSLTYSQNSRPVDWPGALYYEIIVTRHTGQKYYTLLGFDLHNVLSNKKRIDVLSINEFDELYVCQKLFQYDGKLLDNLEFEYNEKVVMSLRYNHETKMIVFDHLSPGKPSLEHQYEFYGPDFTYDGLKFERGMWVLYKDIDITN